ncbi:RNA polymerase sigma-70 factor (ECF subfamily) [Aquimarina sp. MAR_2010_214]|uniref:RNA polymerase sigma factor n=1 Tax=Aquimarina sp. MAR_2010_214 TaxID=1250026 RepID=UPI000C704E12|nr:sigma-70 family RNA polymerase sigma factor [Aquimarina sp. MAR_2010_214]PKV50026.1 RNA polymerase sigma-70 factor (ECF subfamily) [Aquimarina sp. MAR_2010_214]
MENRDHIDHTLNHLFRQESGKMVSVLIKIFGIENIELAEDVVQDALVKALETWKFRGMPDNPRAWLYRTAKNKAIDIIRHNKHSRVIDFSDPEKQLLTSGYTLATTMDNYWQEQHIKDDFLGMMYACCHPDISQENQITFILKALCGFSTKEVARSFLSNEDTISKRLYRTKEYFRKRKIRPVIPTSDEINPRTKTVLNAIYLMFNEGYNSTHADQLIRKDLISQAMFLCKSLLSEKRTQLPEVYALMGLMCFHASRINSRLTEEGRLILLSEQDRTTWDTELIQSGEQYLNKAAFGDELSTYHLEAAIAYQHCCAKKYADTNWEMILEYYELLLKIANDPIVFLNRCLVILELKGPKKALIALENMKSNRLLEKYYLYHAILGEIYQQLEDNSVAVTYYQKAIELTHSKQERQFLKDKIARISK